MATPIKRAADERSGGTTNDGTQRPAAAEPFGARAAQQQQQQQRRSFGAAAPGSRPVDAMLQEEQFQQFGTPDEHAARVRNLAANLEQNPIKYQESSFANPLYKDLYANMGSVM
jgi:hypothetical protein